VKILRLKKDDLLVGENIVRRICDYNPLLLEYFLPWCQNVNYFKKEKTIVCQYPYFGRVDEDVTRNYILDEERFSSFFYHKMYTEEPEIDGFSITEDFGRILFAYELPPKRSCYEDGQLKITTDAMLAVDALPSRDSLRILVIGCASYCSGISGLAYDVLGYMVTNSVFFMYDQYTTDCEYTIGTNKYYCFKKLFDYDSITGKDYDLVLDDAWVEDKYHKDFDKNDSVYKIKNYSVKKFPMEFVRNKKIYYQAFKTTGREERVVSRDIKYNFRYLPIGNCHGCVELKYLLKRDYDNCVYDMYLDCHRVNCITKERRQLRIEEPVTKFVRVVKKADFYRNIGSNKVYVLPWDTNEMAGQELLTLARNVIMGAFLRVSDFLLCTGFVLKNVKCVFKEQGDLIHYVSEDDYGREEQIYDIQVGAQEQVNATGFIHNQKFKKRRQDDVTKVTDISVARSTFKMQFVGEITYKVECNGDIINKAFRRLIQEYCIRREIKGCVSNVYKDGNSRVCILFNGTVEQKKEFISFLRNSLPPHVKMKHLLVASVEKMHFSDFQIIK